MLSDADFGHMPKTTRLFSAQNRELGFNPKWRLKGGTDNLLGLSVPPFIYVTLIRYESGRSMQTLRNVSQTEIHEDRSHFFVTDVHTYGYLRGVAF